MTDPQALSNFRHFVLADPAALARLKGRTDPTDFAREAAQLAAENGFAVTQDDIAAVLRGEGPGELDDAQLASVAGGANPMTFVNTVCVSRYGNPC